VTRHPQLADEEDIEGCAQSDCDLVRYRDASARQCKNENVISISVLFEKSGQNLTGFSAVTKDALCHESRRESAANTDAGSVRD
jgi:hypothetical protein